MEVQIGERVILLKDEVLPDQYVAAAHQLAAVDRVDDAGIHLPITCNCNWKPKATLIVSPEELADPHRFMRVREQVVDGLTFTPEAPNKSGYYWFYGKTSRHARPALHSVRVHNSSSDERSVTQYWCGGDMQFSGSEFSMIGIWAPQWRPAMPGLTG